MLRVEAALCELSVIEFGLGREGQKAQEELVIAGFFALRQEGLGMIGVFEIPMAVIAAGVAGDEVVVVVEAEPVGIGFQRQRLAGSGGRDGIAVGVQGDAELPGGAPLGHRGDIEGMEGKRVQGRLFTVPQLKGWFAGLAMQPHIGDGVEPGCGGGSQQAEVGDIETGQERLFHLAHAVFHPALFMALAPMTRHDATTIVLGKGRRLGLDHGRFTEGALEHSGCEIVNHDAVRDAIEKLKGVLGAGEEVLHGLRDGARDVHQAAIAQHHDNEAQASAGLPDSHRAKRAPIGLGALARSTGEGEKGGLARGADGTPIGFDGRVAALKALLA
jgi:hypothetical protein